MTAPYPIEVNPRVEFILPKQKLVLVKSPGPLLSRIPELFAEEETMDFRFLCENDEEVRAHRAILFLYSNFFDNRKEVLRVKGVRAESIANLMQVLYLGSAALGKTAMAEVRRLWKLFKLHGTLVEGEAPPLALPTHPIPFDDPYNGRERKAKVKSESQNTIPHESDEPATGMHLVRCSNPFKRETNDEFFGAPANVLKKKVTVPGPYKYNVREDKMPKPRATIPVAEVKRTYSKRGSARSEEVTPKKPATKPDRPHISPSATVVTSKGVQHVVTVPTEEDIAVAQSIVSIEKVGDETIVQVADMGDDLPSGEEFTVVQSEAVSRDTEDVEEDSIHWPMIQREVILKTGEAAEGEADLLQKSIASSLGQEFTPVAAAQDENAKALMKAATEVSRIEALKKNPLVSKIIYKCSKCEKTFNMRARWINHQKSHAHKPPKEFRCDRCRKSYGKRTVLNRHRRTCDGSGLKVRTSESFNCDQCDFFTGSKFQLKIHAAKAHGVAEAAPASAEGENVAKTTTPETCPVCSKTVKSLKDHMKVHSVEGSFICPTCGKEFARKDRLRVHEKYHDAKPVTCEECGKTLASAQQMSRHMLIHTGVKNFKCAYCEAAFTDKQSRRAHESVHTGVRPHPCKDCARSFTNAQQLVLHTRRVHTGERPYQCHLCDESFYDKPSQEDHVHIHTGERPYACEYCSKTFSNRKTFWHHRSSKHLAEKRGTFKCGYCDKLCHSQVHLMRHQQVHTGDRQHKCAYCSKEFYRKQNLTIHERIHTGETPFPCNACTKKFRSRKGLIQHLTCHTDSKPYECSICNNAYKGVSNLKKHMRAAHGIGVQKVVEQEIIVSDLNVVTDSVVQ